MKYALLFVLLLSGCVQTQEPLQDHLSLETIQLPAIDAHTIDANIFVHFLDVGQGDAILITYKEEAILIDAGNTGKGSAIVWPYLRDQNITKVNYLIASHIHADHLGGLDEVIQEGLPFEYALGSYQACATRACAQLDALTKHKEVEYQVGDFLSFPFPIQILNPAQPLQFKEANDNSLVLLLVVKEVSFLFTGDCELECEHAVMNAFPFLSATVLKVGHHGSRTSSSPAFLQQVNPEIAVISAGAGNTYGHPHEETLQALEDGNVIIHRTDLEGSVVLTSDGVTVSLVE